MQFLPAFGGGGGGWGEQEASALLSKKKGEGSIESQQKFDFFVMILCLTVPNS